MASPERDRLGRGEQHAREQVPQRPMGGHAEHHAGDSGRSQKGHAELSKPVELLKCVEAAPEHDHQRQEMPADRDLGLKPAILSKRFRQTWRTESETRSTRRWSNQMDGHGLKEDQDRIELDHRHTRESVGEAGDGMEQQQRDGEGDRGSEPRATFSAHSAPSQCSGGRRPLLHEPGEEPADEEDQHGRQPVPDRDAQEARLVHELRKVLLPPGRCIGLVERRNVGDRMFRDDPDR